MNFQLTISSAFIIIVLGSATIAYANNENAPANPQKAATDLIIQQDKIYDPDTLSYDSLVLYEKKFDFDWNNYTSITPNKKKMDEVDAFIKKTHSDDYSKLSNADQQALGKIVYKLGTYYIHVLREPNAGIEKINLAVMLLKDKKDKAWAYNQLAYAYEQKYSADDEDTDKNKALDYSKKVISEFYPNTKNKEVAFAYYVKGLVENDAAAYADAEESLQNAIKMHETIPGGKDDQYAIAKNTLANIMLGKDGNEQEALAMLKQLQRYWEAKGNVDHNPYAAINYLSLGEADMKLGNTKIARDELKKAVNILQNIYGDNSQLLAEPYQLLSDAYLKLGNQKLSAAYEHKADELNRG